MLQMLQYVFFNRIYFKITKSIFIKNVYLIQHTTSQTGYFRLFKMKASCQLVVSLQKFFIQYTYQRSR